MDDEIMNRNKRFETIAQVCHEANVAWCAAHGEDSQGLWSEAPEWQRESAIKGVEFALKGSSPEEQHEAWRRDKEKDGWVCGPVKDAEKKTHPCIVHYKLLPPMQKAKDSLFCAIVGSLAPVLGLK